MGSAGQKLFGMRVCAVFALAVFAAVAVQAQQAVSGRVMGTVTAVSGNAVSVKTDAGASASVTVPDAARILQTAPGQKTLTGATKIAVSGIAAGDRVLMVVAGDPPTASIVVVNKASDIAAKQQQEQADWTKRGVGGLVKSVDASSGAVTITQGTRTILIQTAASTAFRRYAPDSVKFSDAQASTLAAIQPGDQVQARGDKDADGTEVTAEEVVSGSFRNIAGTVISVDGSGSFTVKDLVTKKTVTIKTTPDSDLRKLDPQMAQAMAMRLRAAGNGSGAAAGSGSGAGNGAPSAGAGAAPGGQGGGQWRQGGGNSGTAGGGGLARLLQRSPQIQISDLHKGDAVMIVATSGSPDAATAIRLVAGVEPMLQASASGSQSMFSSAWSLGGGQGDQGGGDNP